MLFASLFGWVFELIGLVAILGGGAWLILRLLNRRTVTSAGHYARTKVGQVGDAIHSLDPAGQMRQAALDGLDDMRNIDKALVASRDLSKSLQEQISKDTREMNRKIAKIRQLLSQGIPDNDPQITTRLEAIKTLKEAIATNSEQELKQAAVYKSTLASANAATTKLTATVQKADQYQVQLDLGEADLKLQQMINEYDPSAVNSKLAEVTSYEAEVKKRLRNLQSQAEVANDRRAALDLDDDVQDPSELADLLMEIKGTPKPAPPAAPTTNS